MAQAVSSPPVCFSLGVSPLVRWLGPKDGRGRMGAGRAVLHAQWSPSSVLCGLGPAAHLSGPPSPLTWGEQGATCWGCGSWGRKGEGAGEGHGGVQLWTLAHEDAASLSEQDRFAHVRTAGVQHHCPQEGTTVCPGRAFRAQME